MTECDFGRRESEWSIPMGSKRGAVDPEANLDSAGQRQMRQNMDSRPASGFFGSDIRGQDLTSGKSACLGA